jgi:PAS domain-containing protein
MVVPLSLVFNTYLVEESADANAHPPRQIKDANSLRVILLDVSQNRLGSLLKADLVSVIKRQRMKSVSELSKMAADLDVLMENVPMGTIIFDENSRVERLNNWMLAKLGYTSHEHVTVRAPPPHLSPRKSVGDPPMTIRWRSVDRSIPTDWTAQAGCMRCANERRA